MDPEFTRLAEIEAAESAAKKKAEAEAKKREAASRAFDTVATGESKARGEANLTAASTQSKGREDTASITNSETSPNAAMKSTTPEEDVALKRPRFRWPCLRRRQAKQHAARTQK